MTSCWTGCLEGFRGKRKQIVQVGERAADRDNAQVWHTARAQEAVGHCVERYSVGDGIQVYSHSAQAWCSGVVETVDDQVVTVAFQLPGASNGDYGRKHIPMGHPDLRHARKPLQWSQDEQAVYPRLMEAAGVSDEHPNFFMRSGLPRAALKEVWAVANPASKSQLSHEDFWLCCRMIGHCQAMMCSEEQREILEHGGAHLHSMLEAVCIDEPPQEVPQFSDGGRLDSPGAVSQGSGRSCNGGTRSIFTQEEQINYANIMMQAGPPDQHSKFLERSGLPRRSLKEIWNLANPEMRSWLGSQEFWMCCRLVGHCQELRGVPGMAQTLEAGGPELVHVLQETSCHSTPPKHIPNFHLPSPVVPFLQPAHALIQVRNAIPVLSPASGQRFAQTISQQPIPASVRIKQAIPPLVPGMRVVSASYQPHPTYALVATPPVSPSYQPPSSVRTAVQPNNIDPLLQTSRVSPNGFVSIQSVGVS